MFGDGLLSLIGDGYVHVPITRLLGLPHLQTKKMQMFYEPVLEDRHMPLIYSFKADQASVAHPVARQTLFNGMHFFSNKLVNRVYNLLDGDARKLQPGSLKKGHLYDLFNAARHAGAYSFKFRERIFPREKNSRRKQLNNRPDYHEVEGVINSDGKSVETTPDLDQGKRLTDLRNFWRDKQVDRIRNIRLKGDGTNVWVTPTGSLNSVYDRPPLTTDGEHHEIRQFSHGFYARPPDLKDNIPGESNEKHHIAAGLSTHYQTGYIPYSSDEPVIGSLENGDKFKGRLQVDPIVPIPTKPTFFLFQPWPASAHP